MNVDIYIQTGPARYCPDCRRKLCEVDADGTITVAGKAVVELAGEGIVLVDRQGNTLGNVPTYVIEAHCMLLTCRIRRWLAHHKPR